MSNLVAVISDTHAGVRSDNQVLLDNQKLFYDNVFFPTLKKRKITTVLHGGDVVDRRKSINFNTLQHLQRDFLDPLTLYQVHMVIGNHDTYFKDTNDLNFFDEFIAKAYPNFHLYSKNPQDVKIQGVNVCMVPWIAESEEAEHAAFAGIKKSKAKICLGHFNLKGFETSKGSFSQDGLETDFLDKFETVLSGHFHHKSTSKNITYVGCPFEMTWSDYGDPKGFHLLDLDTQELEFIENPYRLFHKIEYKDELINDLDRYKETYVKVVVKKKENLVLFDRLINDLEKLPVLNVQIVDDSLNLNIEAEDVVDQAESTFDILKKSISQAGISPALEGRLEELLKKLYHEASIVQA